jgi:predicted NAD/FAD-binding protein
MKIAIIGSGIAGLTSAYLLNRRHDIRLFEASDWIGGHTHTLDVEVQGKSYAVDSGFIVFNDWTYPNFIRLLNHLDVGFKPTEMSFSVSDPLSGVEYNGHSLNSLFAQRRNLLSAKFWGMLRDILRFNREALADLHNQRIDAHTSLGDYLSRKGYGERFIQHYIVPMGAAIWSMSLHDMLGFPLQFFVRFFKNHGLLSVSERPQWCVVEGGSSSYVAPLTASFRQHIRLNCPVLRVERDAKGVTLHSALGAERFDKVVFACHSDQALALLAASRATPPSASASTRPPPSSRARSSPATPMPTRSTAWPAWPPRRAGRNCSAPTTATSAAPTGPMVFMKTAWSARCAWRTNSARRCDEQRPVQRLGAAQTLCPAPARLSLPHGPALSGPGRAGAGHGPVTPGRARALRPVRLSRDGLSAAVHRRRHSLDRCGAPAHRRGTRA